MLSADETSPLTWPPGDLVGNSSPRTVSFGLHFIPGIQCGNLRGPGQSPNGRPSGVYQAMSVAGRYVSGLDDLADGGPVNLIDCDCVGDYSATPGIAGMAVSGGRFRPAWSLSRTAVTP